MKNSTESALTLCFLSILLMDTFPTPWGKALAAVNATLWMAITLYRLCSDR